MLCRKCGSEKAHRSRRRGVIDSIASLVQLVPYRCGACNRRFYVRGTAGTSDHATPEPSKRPLIAKEEPPAPDEVKHKRRRKPKGMIERFKEMLDVRREKRIRIGTQLFIYGFALMLFLVILYGITIGGIPGF